MSDTAQTLESLADLKQKGIITEEEFQQQKSKILNNAFAPTPAATITKGDDSDLSPKWQERFAFFDTYGNPNSPSAKQALNRQGLGYKLRIQANWTAFFFTIIYLLVLGLWRRALAIFAVNAAVNIALVIAGYSGLATAFGFGISAYCMWTTNYAYYLKRRGLDS